MSARIRMRKVSSTSKGKYNFRIIVIHSGKPRDSREIEELGYYDPARQPESLQFKSERYEYWLKKGAKPSDTVASLYKRFKKKAQ